MPADPSIDIVKKYASFMGEVKIRMSAIEASVNGRIGLVDPLVREFCFLQLRMTCELIALGCLTAHGEMVGVNKLTKEYHAGVIMRRLSELHPTFYPRPIKPKPGIPPVNYDHDNITSGFLTKNELVELYRRCGDTLHKGDLRKQLSPTVKHPRHFRDIITWCDKILTLLSVHYMAMIGDRRVMLCGMAAGPSKQVNVVIADAMEL